MLLHIVGLTAGIILLLAGAELFVKGATGISMHFRIPEYAVGATVVAIGTSLPEFITSTYASVTGHPQISVSNVIGSNIFNIAFVMGISAIIKPIRIERDLFKKDAPMLLASLVLLFGLSFDKLIGRFDGLLLSLIFISYLIFLMQEREEAVEALDDYAPGSALTSILMVAFGGILLFVGSKLAVDSGNRIAVAFGIKEWFIGATAIAAGTGLPEFMTSIIAVIRKRRGIAVGNIIGSNIINIIGVIGMASLAAPIGVEPMNIYFDFFYLFLLSMLFILMVSDREISREAGILLFATYIVYIQGIFHLSYAK